MALYDASQHSLVAPIHNYGPQYVLGVCFWCPGIQGSLACLAHVFLSLIYARLAPPLLEPTGVEGLMTALVVQPLFGIDSIYQSRYSNPAPLKVRGGYLLILIYSGVEWDGRCRARLFH